MDNDYQVGREVARVKELFLTETFGSQVQPPKLYSVEDEFAKTRKNRNPVVTLTIFGFVVVFVAVAAVTTLLIQRTSQQVDFDINEFQDINLTEILDVQKRNENALETALRELAELEREQARQIREIRSDISGKIEIVNNEDLPVDVRRTRTIDLRNEEAARIAAVEREFGPKIAAKREEIETIQARIDEYDARLIEEARRTEKRLNNQQRLFEIQTQELRDYYETRISDLEQTLESERVELTRQKDELVALLRRNHAAELRRQYLLYNPTFEEPAVTALLERDLGAPHVDTSMLPGYPALFASENVLSSGSFDGLRSSIKSVELLLDRLDKVPYENSIPEAFAALRDLETIIIARYEYLWGKLADRIDTKNSIIAEQKETIRSQLALIDRFNYAVDFLARDSRENGYILDARDRGDMLVYVNPTLPVPNGSTAYVFREVDDFIGEIRVYGRRAELVELADAARPIEPFDVFLIQLQ